MCIKDIKDQGYNISDEGEIDEYLGVKIKKKAFMFSIKTITASHACCRHIVCCSMAQNDF